MGGRAGGGGAGMGSGSRGMASSLRNIESSIRNLPVEHAYVLDANGKVLDHLVGDEGKVEGNWDRFSDKGITITHNHPEDASFSNPDVWTGIRLNAKEIRATANGHTYSLKPGKNGYKIYFNVNTVVMNYKFAAAAGEYGTNEYNIMKGIREDFPGMAEVVVSAENEALRGKI